MSTPYTDNSDLSFKVFHELMARRIKEILLVSSPYDAFIIEEDGRLAERVIHEYRGLNLSRPPRFTWVSSAREAFHALTEKQFDLVIMMPRLDDMDPHVLGREIKKQYDCLPVVLLAHDTSLPFLESQYPKHDCFDKLFVWKGNTDILLAIIKSVEDFLNVADDTARARVRVIILVEDSPKYRSSLLPLLYKELVLQTQAVMEESLNEEHRILKMRARPKILLAEDFEEAERLYNQYKPYLLSVITDVRFQRNNRMDDRAGLCLLDMIKGDAPGVPLLVLSSEEANRENAAMIPAEFINKNSHSFLTDIRSFLKQHLAFGDFIFRFSDGREVARAANLREMERVLPDVPEESVLYHADSDHFSTWLMARSEIQLASKLRAGKSSDFSSTQEIKEYLVSCIRESRKGRQKGVVTDFVADDFDAAIDFFKIGKGSLGGKARGLAFISSLFKKNPEFAEMFPDINISVPKTLVIATDGFDSFINEKQLKELAGSSLSDAAIMEKFLGPRLPEWLRCDLESFLKQVDYPLAIRSSSLLEDDQYQPYAGIYKTYMIPNNHADISVRLDQLVRAIKLVYASTYLETPRSFAKSILRSLEEEKMAVIVQQVVGRTMGEYFFPHISGVAQSYNFYPLSYMKPEEGIAHIAFGFGKTVVEGGQALRISPKYPQFLPQFSTVDDVLKNSQRLFYALKMSGFPDNFDISKESVLVQVAIDDLKNNRIDQAVVRDLVSTYIPEEHRIRDSIQGGGRLLLTFAGILKYRSLPLAEILCEILKMGRKGMGSPVEIEFAVSLPDEEREKKSSPAENAGKPEFALLQIRPMALQQQDMDVDIAHDEIAGAFCFSSSALGNGMLKDIVDIVYVKQETFDSVRSQEIAAEIGKINRLLIDNGRRYLLIGPGRWGSADRFLGIPVNWNDISGVGAIIEAATDKLQADPSYGSHFFHNITSLGISYITVTKKGDDFLEWSWLKSLPAQQETRYLRHVRLEKPLTIKIDGKTSQAVIKKT